MPWNLVVAIGVARPLATAGIVAAVALVLFAALVFYLIRTRRPFRANLVGIMSFEVPPPADEQAGPSG